jgi:hypothetical protein
MSDLQDLYVKSVGHQFERIENKSWYLSELAIRSAIEVDNYLLGRNRDFSHLQELSGILAKYQLRDSDTSLTEPDFPYLPFWEALRSNSPKTIHWISELALEMRLFRSELEDSLAYVQGNNIVARIRGEESLFGEGESAIPVQRKNLEDLRYLLCELSKEFANERYKLDHARVLV